jgi:Kef-type K+ transport system membrane component KefB
MILAGVVVGEHGFNILEKDSSFELFGKVGLYYIMFLAGLEMDMEDFKKNRFKGLLFGLLTFSIPMFLGVYSGMYILDYGLATAVLLASLYASHTLIAYPIISRYGLTKLRCVSIAVSGTILTDTLALLILAVIAGMYKGNLDEYYWFSLSFKVIVFTFIIIFFFPRISRWFFRTHENSITQYIFVLAMLFLGAGLLEWAGLEGILGAFMVGLVLNRLIPHVSPLMNRIEFVGNALFIPYFLIGVGMIIDVHTLFTQGETLKVAAVMTIVAITGKWTAAWLVQKIFGMHKDERQIIFGLSNAQAAATLAAVLVGNRIEISPGVLLLDNNILNGTVVMILITCIISSFAAEKAARNISLDGDLIMPDEGTTEEEKILIPVSNPETIEGLMGMALLMKDPKRNDGLVALSVINDNNASESVLARGRKSLERTAMVAAAVDVKVATATRFDQSTVSGIIHAVKEYNATEVVIGLHRKATIVDSFFGALAENLLKGMHRQVMIVKCLMPANTLRRIIVAVPVKAEYEAGFLKWIDRLCRMGGQLGCRIHFFAHPETLRYLESYVRKKHKNVRTEFTAFPNWEDLLLLTGQVNYDHLLVIVSARRGSISYSPLFEKLPMQISKYFNNNSLLVLYPDQYGDPQDTLSFSDLGHHNESQHYEAVGRWFYKWFKKS